MIVETKKILIDSKLKCASGEALESFELMTDFYGELNEKKDNAVLVCHAFSGSHHAAGKRGNSVGWWDEFIGPDKTIDTNLSKFLQSLYRLKKFSRCLYGDCFSPPFSIVI